MHVAHSHFVLLSLVAREHDHLLRCPQLVGEDTADQGAAHGTSAAGHRDGLVLEDHSPLLRIEVANSTSISPQEGDSWENPGRKPDESGLRSMRGSSTGWIATCDPRRPPERTRRAN